jgi:hypothetical protein
LPDGHTLTGWFGSLPGVGGLAAHDDSIIIRGTSVFVVSPGGGGLF